MTAARRIVSTPKKCFISRLFYSRIRVTEIGTRLDSLRIIRKRSLSRVETPEQETIQAQTEPAAPAPESSGLRTLRTWVRDLFFSVLVSFFIILFVYQPVKVEGGSMEPGLEDHERLFINKLVYRLPSIERGDIVLFRYPSDTRKSFIKRVIGLPGDHIKIGYAHVYVNDEQLTEPYVTSDSLCA